MLNSSFACPLFKHVQFFFNLQGGRKDIRETCGDGCKVPVDSDRLMLRSQNLHFTAPIQQEGGGMWENFRIGRQPAQTSRKANVLPDDFIYKNYTICTLHAVRSNSELPNPLSF